MYYLLLLLLLFYILYCCCEMFVWSTNKIPNFNLIKTILFRLWVCICMRMCLNTYLRDTPFFHMFRVSHLDKLCCTYVYRAYSAGRRAVGDVYPLFR